jgi:nucleotide-binding universal stress UspA family protein
MFEKILVCLDGSELAEQILPYAAEQARRFCSQVSLLHVMLEPVMAGTGAAGGPEHLEKPGVLDQMQKEQQQTVTYLARVAAHLREDGVEVEPVLLQGSPGDAIVNYANDNNIGLIAMASHGRSGLGRAVFGSVAEYVLRNAGRPVLVVRPRSAGARK